MISIKEVKIMNLNFQFNIFHTKCTQEIKKKKKDYQEGSKQNNAKARRKTKEALKVSGSKPERL